MQHGHDAGTTGFALCLVANHMVSKPNQPCTSATPPSLVPVTDISELPTPANDRFQSRARFISLSLGWLRVPSCVELLQNLTGMFAPFLVPHISNPFHFSGLTASPDFARLPAIVVSCFTLTLVLLSPSRSQFNRNNNFGNTPLSLG